MIDRPILFSAPMVRALLAGTKSQTRRIVKPPHQNPLGTWEPTSIGGGGIYDSKGRKVPFQGAIWHTRTGDVIGCPYGGHGDRLWVRETWAVDASLDQVRREIEDAMPSLGHGPYFRADGVHENSGLTWRPSIHMPRWASRITLEVTGVRVERVQEISEPDAIAEGVESIIAGSVHYRDYLADCDNYNATTARKSYETLFESINGYGSWDANPWVWIIEFRRVAP